MTISLFFSVYQREKSVSNNSLAPALSIYFYVFFSTGLYLFHKIQ